MNKSPHLKMYGSNGQDHARSSTWIQLVSTSMANGMNSYKRKTSVYDYLIRASPQQLRPASLREFKSTQRGSDGNVEVPKISSQCRIFVDLGDNAPEVEMSQQEEQPLPTPAVPMSTTDNGEMFPPDLLSNGTRSG